MRAMRWTIAALCLTALAAVPVNASATLTCEISTVHVKAWHRVWRRRDGRRVRVRVSYLKAEHKKICGLPETGSVGAKLYADDHELIAVANVESSVATAGGAEPRSGDRFIAVQISLSDIGSEPISAFINRDMTVMGANNEFYSPVSQESATCPDFSAGHYSLAPGQGATGCVLYELPEHVVVRSIEFDVVVSYLGGVEAEWTV